MSDLFALLDSGTDKVSAVGCKNIRLKKSILTCLTVYDELTIAELSKALDVSVPTVTKLVLELKDEGLLQDKGKIETAGGRRPNVFGLVPEGLYFVGVDVREKRINLLLVDFMGNPVSSKEEIPYVLENNMESLEKVCQEVDIFMAGCNVPADKVAGIGFCMPGHVDSRKGCSYACFTCCEEPLCNWLVRRFGKSVFLENDSRVMLFAEKCVGVVEDEKNVLFLNIGREINSALMFDGKLYYGKTGLAGEFGHIPLFDNQLLCRCGKKGCLETEVSGKALESVFARHLEMGETSILSKEWKKGKDVLMYDIIKAANRGDVLSLSLIAGMSDKLGRGVGILVNLLNPDLVVVGGSFSACGENLMLPLKAGVNKYSSSLLGKETCFKLSALGENACALGCALTVRKNLLQTE